VFVETGQQAPCNLVARREGRLPIELSWVLKLTMEPWYRPLRIATAVHMAELFGKPSALPAFCVIARR
jgi:hypothetical protein